jgi:hypothetical protein
MIGAAKDKSSLPGSLTALRVLLCLLITFLLAGTRAEAFFAPPDQAPGQIAAFQPDSTGKTTTAWQYDALDSLIAAKEAGSVFPKGYQGGPGAMWVNEGRGLWKLTAEGADKVMSHGRFGTFYRSSSDGLWWAADNAGHGGSAFKVFRERGKGLEWFRDADQFGDFIGGKHKGATGQFIPWKELKGH